MTRSVFCYGLISILGVIACGAVSAQSTQRPNIILIMTDDQGYGDFGFTGNPVIQTPNLDALASTSLQVPNFYVCPVCAPTRACLMTGRYNYRTGVVDTYQGRAMMHSDEFTLAELLAEAGYATGIFGKWHLGDNYPMRPIDQGFRRSVVHRGGGIGQSSDPLEAEGKYTNPILMVDGAARPFTGFCTDIYYQQATEFISNCVKKEEPFFVYLPDNCPHDPFNDVPEKWYQRYREMDLSNQALPNSDENPLPAKTNSDRRARIFAMISNIDENIGRLQKSLAQLGVEKNTIIIFLTDNGPNGRRYVAGMRGMKTSVYQGGIRTPLLLNWPARINRANTVVSRLTHIDLFPTLAEFCGLAVPQDLKLDGRSFASVVDQQTAGPIRLGGIFEERTLFIQSHRGNRPMRYHHFAAIGPRYKLVHHSGFHRESFAGSPEFELFDLRADPGETRNLSATQPQMLQQLVANYNRWFDDVAASRDQWETPRIVLDRSQENPVWLTRQDARRDVRPPGAEPRGLELYWRLEAPKEDSYRVICHFKKIETDQRRIVLRINGASWTAPFNLATNTATFQDVRIRKGACDLTAHLEDGDGDVYSRHVYQVEIHPSN